jgi:membrane protein DedA with SNARE-associated domain
MIEFALFQLGYVGLAVGAFLEGEVIVILAGLLAHAGYLSIFWVIVIAILATFAGDQFFFYIGKHKSQRIFSLFPHLAKQVEKSKGMISAHQNKIMATFRFLYGLRIATLIALGASGVPQKKFVLWNVFNSIVWSFLFSLGGYYFGSTFESFFKGFKHFEKRALISLAVFIGFMWLLTIVLSYIRERRAK